MKETFIQKLIKSKASSNKVRSRKENGSNPSKKSQPSSPSEVDEDGTTSDQRLRKSTESTSTDLRIHFSKPHVILQDNSNKLTGIGAPGSHSALFGLTSDGKKEGEAGYSSSKQEPVQSAEAWSSDESADLVTASFDRGVMNVPEIRSTNGSSTANDGASDSVFSTWAAANTSVATHSISSACHDISSDAALTAVMQVDVLTPLVLLD
jgi:hypothetical protein